MVVGIDRLSWCVPANFDVCRAAIGETLVTGPQLCQVVERPDGLLAAGGIRLDVHCKNPLQHPSTLHVSKIDLWR
jgi:hypothetical protein